MAVPDSRQLAVALAYQTGGVAPTVTAKGHGLVAQAIIEKAREAGVYVHESPELVSLLMQVNIDEHIPPELYIAVAELLAWLYRLEHGEQEMNEPIATPPPPPLPTNGLRK